MVDKNKMKKYLYIITLRIDRLHKRRFWFDTVNMQYKTLQGVLTSDIANSNELYTRIQLEAKNIFNTDDNHCCIMYYYIQELK